MKENSLTQEGKKEGKQYPAETISDGDFADD